MIQVGKIASSVDNINSAEVANAVKTVELAEKEQEKDSEPDEPVNKASLRKTAEDLCSQIIKDVVDDIFASETQDLGEKEGICSLKFHQ